MYRQELWFLWSACHLIMLYISMKFHENILSCFQVTEWTRLHDGGIDGQTDRLTDNQAKNNKSPPLSGGDIRIKKSHLKATTGTSSNNSCKTKSHFAL